MGGSDRERSRNHPGHPIDVREHIVIPEPQHAEPLATQIAIAPLIGPRIAVLPAIDLHDQSLFKAGEIGDVGTYDNLPSEFAAGYLTLANGSPEMPLRIGHVMTQRTSKIELLTFAHPCESLTGTSKRCPAVSGFL